MTHHKGCNWIASPNLSLTHGFWCDCGACNPVESFNVMATLQVLSFLIGVEVRGQALVSMEQIKEIPLIRTMEGTFNLKEM